MFYRCFLVQFEFFFRKPILRKICERLLPLLKNILWSYYYRGEMQSRINVSNYNRVGYTCVQSEHLKPWDTAQKMKFSIKDFYCGLVTFTEEILNGKFHFLCREKYFPWRGQHYLKQVHYRGVFRTLSSI